MIAIFQYNKTMGLIQLPQKKRIRRKLANSASLRQARQEHEQWLNSLGIDRSRKKKKVSEPLVLEKLEDRTGVPLGNRPPVAVKGRAEANEYSGERKLIGIATMHKSNQVPVFADDNAEGREKATEISKMRRG